MYLSSNFSRAANLFVIITIHHVVTTVFTKKVRGSSQPTTHWCSRISSPPSLQLFSLGGSQPILGGSANVNSHHRSYWSSRGTVKPTTVRTDAAAGVGGIVLPVQRKQFAAIVGITDSATDQRASPAAVVRCT